MEAKELRIKNLVYYNGTHKEVGYVSGIKSQLHSLDRINLNYRIDITYNVEEIEPIPLTEEWLLIFGFENVKGNDYYHKDFDRLYCNVSNPLIKYLGNHNGILRETEYVHQLQNLFFALTGKELTLKSD